MIRSLRRSKLGSLKVVVKALKRPRSKRTHASTRKMWPTTPLLDRTASVETPSAVVASTTRRGAVAVIMVGCAGGAERAYWTKVQYRPSNEGGYCFFRASALIRYWAV